MTHNVFFGFVCVVRALKPVLIDPHVFVRGPVQVERLPSETPSAAEVGGEGIANVEDLLRAQGSGRSQEGGVGVGNFWGEDDDAVGKDEGRL